MRWLRRHTRRERIAMPQSTPRPAAGYLVGGAVRDALLGREARDLDWLVADPEAEALRAAAALGGSAFVLDRARGHWRAVGGGVTLDYTPLVGSLEDDLGRRDFTLNAIAAGPDGHLVDPLDGRGDALARRLRMTSEAALADDPVRPLRGVRFAATLALEITPATQRAIVRLSAEQASGGRPKASPERVRDELEALLADAACARGLLLADELRVLDVVLPVLAACRGVEQGGFHHLDVLRHSLEALNQLVQGFPEADAALRWATLLHDVGKPATRSLGEDGRTHFYGHARHGETLALDTLTRLRLANVLAHRVAALVRYHMLPLPADDKAARRFVHRRRTLLPDLLKLMIADREAARGPLSSEANRRAYRMALARVLEILDEAPARPPLLDGEAVMRVLGIPPGPRVGEALRLVDEAEAVGDVATPEEAAALLRRYADAQGWR
jgi:poly(A) polymerase